MGKTNLILNDEVRCFSYPYEAEMVPMTTVMRNALGVVKQSFVHDSHDWMTYSINMDQLQEADRDDLMDFVLALGGNVDSFLFRDEFGYGNVIPRQSIGTKSSSGSLTLQVKRAHTVGSVSRSYDVWNIENNGTFKLWIGGTLKTLGVDYALNYLDDGTVDISSASTGTVEVEGEYLRRCRFTGNFRNILRAYDTNSMALGFAEEGIDSEGG